MDVNTTDAGNTSGSCPVSPYLTCTEAAAYLRTTSQGIYAPVKRGRLRPMPGSGKLLFTRGELDASLKSRRRAN